jgi:glutamate carboxypeptidase
MTDDLKGLFEAKTEAMVDLVKELVMIESPTYVKQAVDDMGDRIQEELTDLGAEVTVEQRATVGDIVIGEWNADAPGKPLLFVCHMDTVYPLGSLTDNPLRVEGGLLYGPGTSDEKGGIVTTLMALRTLMEEDMLPERPITALFTSDEETGSEYSHELIKTYAKRAALALIMEAAMPDGSLKTWRKSTGRYVLHARGKKSHAGGAHEFGVNAIEELAHHVLALQGMTNHKVGTTVNVGMISGGIARNVVPDVAEAVVDVRAATHEEMTRLDNAIKALRPELLGAELDIEGGFDRVPMVRDDRMIATFEQAKAICEPYGITLRESGTGGASDGNFTAEVGTPTLDGLGPIGNDPHSERENVIITSLNRSATILAALILDWPSE